MTMQKRRTRLAAGMLTRMEILIQKQFGTSSLEEGWIQAMLLSMIGNHQKIIPIDEKELLTKLQQITGPSRTVLLLSGRHCSPGKSWCLCWYQSFSRHYQRILSLGIDFPIHSLGQQNKSFLSNAEKMPSRLPSCNLLGLGGWISLGSVRTF